MTEPVLAPEPRFPFLLLDVAADEPEHRPAVVAPREVLGPAQAASAASQSPAVAGARAGAATTLSDAASRSATPMTSPGARR